MGHLQAIEAVSPSDTHSRDLWAEFDNHTGGSERGSQQIFTIRDLAREFGVTARTLRFYEEKELLSPRRQGQERLYSRRDRARLKLVLMGKRVGFSLTEIKEVLDLYDLKDNQLTQLRVALKKFNEQIGVLEAQKRDCELALDELKTTVGQVADMIKTREKTRN